MAEMTQEDKELMFCHAVRNLGWTIAIRGQDNVKFAIVGEQSALKYITEELPKEFTADFEYYPELRKK